MKLETSLRTFKERFVVPHMTVHTPGSNTHTLNGPSSVALKITTKNPGVESLFVTSSSQLFDVIEGLFDFADEVGCKTVSGNGLWLEGTNDATSKVDRKTGKTVWTNSPCMSVEVARAAIAKLEARDAEAYFGRFDCPTVRIPSTDRKTGRVLTKASKASQDAKASFFSKRG